MAAFSHRQMSQIDGLDAVLRRLDDLPKKLRNKHLKKAITAAARTILQAAKARCPRDLGILRKSLGQKVKVYRHSGAVLAVVGARKGFRLPAIRKKGKWAPAAVQPSGFADPTKYLHLVELGTTRSREVRFLRDALRSATPSVGAKVREAVEAALADGGAS